MSFGQLPSGLEELVRTLEWTYGALWAVNPDSRAVELKDGWYNVNNTLTDFPGHEFHELSMRNEAFFYSSYKSCIFAPGFGYVGRALSKRQDAWLTGSEEIHHSAVLTQSQFLKSARIQLSRKDCVLEQMQRLVSVFASPLCPTSFCNGPSHDAVQMEQTMQPTFVAGHDYNVNLDQSNLNTHRANLSAYEIDHKASKNAGLTQSYSQLQQQNDRSEHFQRPKEDSLVKRLSTVPLSRLEKEDHQMGASILEWPDISSADFFPVDQSIDGPIIPSNMEVRDMDSMVSSMPMQAIETFGHQAGQLGPERNSGVTNHDVVSSMPTGSKLLAEVLPLVNPITNLQPPGGNMLRGPSTASSWHQLGRAGTNIASEPTLADMLEGYTDHGQVIQAPPHQFHGAIYQHSTVKSSWPDEEDFLGPGHGFQYPVGGDGYSRASRNEVQPIQRESLNRAPSAQSEWLSRGINNEPGDPGISFTTPTTWVSWNRKAAAARHKLRAASSNAAAGRLNQLLLKKMLVHIVPRMAAKEQKMRSPKELQAAALLQREDAPNHRVRATASSTTPAETRTESVLQDQQARTHMLAERRRRVRENEHYAALRSLIPPTSRMDKATVLGETIQLVKRLKKRVRQLENVNPGRATPDDSNAQANPSALDSTSDHSASTGGATSQGSERGDDQGGSPRMSPRYGLRDHLEDNPGEAVKEEFTVSNADPMPGTTTPPGADVVPSSQAVKVEDVQKEVVEVLTADGESQNQLRVEIRTLNKPDTLIHILTCFKEDSVRVVSTHITINNNWIQANFQLMTSTNRHRNLPLICTEVQGALRRAVARAPKESHAESNSYAPSINCSQSPDVSGSDPS